MMMTRALNSQLADESTLSQETAAHHECLNFRFMCKWIRIRQFPACQTLSVDHPGRSQCPAPDCTLQANFGHSPQEAQCREEHVGGRHSWVS